MFIGSETIFTSMIFLKFLLVFRGYLEEGAAILAYFFEQLTNCAGVRGC